MGWECFFGDGFFFLCRIDGYSRDGERVCYAALLWSFDRSFDGYDGQYEVVLVGYPTVSCSVFFQLRWID